MKTNLLIIAFDRPHYLEKTLRGLKASDFKNVFAAIDGPRNERDKKKISEVKAVLKKHNIKNIKAQKNNIGINPAFETGISWFYNNVESGVVLEEDCVPNPSFFPFAAEVFKRYKDDPKIGMLTGSNMHPSNQDSYLFSHQFGIWGWGTWSDRWQKYQRITKQSDIKISFRDLLKFTGSFAGALTLHTKFKRLTAPNMGFWDMNWTYTNVINDWLCIIPQKNLITNIGYQGNSTKGKNHYHDRSTQTIDFKNLKHPKVKINLDYDRHIDNHYNLLPALKTSYYQLLNKQKFT